MGKVEMIPRSLAFYVGHHSRITDLILKLPSLKSRMADIGYF